MTHQVPVLLQPTASNPRLHAVAQHAGPEPTGDVVRIALRFELGYEVGPSGADFVFCIHAAQTPRQIVADEVLWLSQDVDARLETDAPTQNRLLRLHANAGELRVHYHATVDMAHTVTPPERLPQVSVDRLPLHVARYILPSRYCQSDRVSELAMDLFAHLPPGYERVLAVQDWVRERVRYESNTSDSATTALDTLDSGKGVCRDFAHVMITMCRALNLPARFTTGTDYGASAALGPPDFHAYVEVFLGGRWCIFDPSGTAIPMGMVRLAVGRDAADVAVAMMFGSVQSQSPRVSATAIEDPARNLVRPVHVDGAISTDLARAAWVSVPASARRAEIN